MLQRRPKLPCILLFVLTMASKLPREPADPANDPDFVNRPFIGAVERVVGQNADLGRRAVGHMLQTFGDEPHAVMQDEDPRRAGALQAEVEQDGIAVFQGWQHAVAFNMQDPQV
jgi:hypothetical protein